MNITVEIKPLIRLTLSIMKATATLPTKGLHPRCNYNSTLYIKYRFVNPKSSTMSQLPWKSAHAIHSMASSHSLSLIFHSYN